MKRIITLLLVLTMLVTLCACGSSNSSTEASSKPSESKDKVSSQITFRGIPFGTSFEETISIFKNEGIEFDFDLIDFNGFTGAYYTLSSSNKIPVAGTEMWLIVKFICLNKTEDVNANIEDCVFYDATYTIFWRDRATKSSAPSMSTLELKLTELYGNPTSKNYSDTLRNPKNMTATWDKGDVIIKLFKSEYEDESGGIEVEYSWKVGTDAQNKYFQRAKEKENERRKKEILSTGTDGL